MSTKRGRDDTGVAVAAEGKAVRIDKGYIKELTLKKIMAAGTIYKASVQAASFITPMPVPLILCEACHRRAPSAEPAGGSPSLVGECRFCSRRSLCTDCWSMCSMCGMETCTLCSVKDYSSRDTVAVCLDCKRHAARTPTRR